MSSSHVGALLAPFGVYPGIGRHRGVMPCEQMSLPWTSQSAPRVVPNGPAAHPPWRRGKRGLSCAPGRYGDRGARSAEGERPRQSRLNATPTCGGGSAAGGAEQWWRCWITCDTGRVALARIIHDEGPWGPSAVPGGGIVGQSGVDGGVNFPERAPVVDAGLKRRVFGGDTEQWADSSRRWRKRSVLWRWISPGVVQPVLAPSALAIWIHSGLYGKLSGRRNRKRRVDETTCTPILSRRCRSVHTWARAHEVGWA